MSGSAYELVKLDKTSYRIEEKGVRMFLFIGESRALLVDTGYGGGDLKALVDSVTKLPVTLVNTHADGDHIGCGRQFGNAFMHPAEFDRFHHQPAGKDLTPAALWEGDVIDLGGHYRFESVLIPGHTPGSVALLDEEHGILLAGDSVQAGMIYMTGHGRNIHAYIDSMKKLRKMNGRFHTVYPSHGPFPVGADILSGLITGAEDLRDGKLTGHGAPFETPAKVYDAGAAKFLF